MTATQDRARRPRAALVASGTRSAPRPVEARALGGELDDFGDNLAAREPPGPPAHAGVALVRVPANDKWPAVSPLLRHLGVESPDRPVIGGAIAGGRHAGWMWADNVSHGDLETFVAGIIPQSELLAYASEASRVAKAGHAAEYEVGHARKAALKVRSVWCDASAAGGYGHLIRNLELTPTPASAAFLDWFRKLSSPLRFDNGTSMLVTRG